MLFSRYMSNTKPSAYMGEKSEICHLYLFNYNR